MKTAELDSNRREIAEPHPRRAWVTPTVEQADTEIVRAKFNSFQEFTTGSLKNGS